MKLVLDNNILFSLMNPVSVNSYLFSTISAEFLAPRFIKSELAKYHNECLLKSKLSKQEFEIRQKDVESSISFLEEEEYSKFLSKAESLISDIKDAPYLAVALSTNSDIWSNDSHLKKQEGVNVYTSSEIIKLFMSGEL